MLKRLARFALGFALMVSACGGGGDGDPTGGGFQISGRVGALSGLRIAGTGNVSHVMAVNPETASPDRRIDEVASDGSFTLDVAPGNPYVLVFVDDSQVGLDMIVGIFRANTLDTLAAAPGTEGGADLGEVGIDGEGVATAETTYDTLLTQLGLSAETALTLGAVDDLSLRMANPDIDGNGAIDMLTQQHFSLDFHVRADNMFQGGFQINPATIDDITNQFLAATGPDAAYVSFGLSSIYAIYPNSYDGTDYVEGGALQNGATYTATHSDASAVDAPTSFSSAPFNDVQQWGADYNLLMNVEMPGSGASPAQIVFGLANSTLTFPNVLTRTQAELESAGTIVPFIRLNTVGDDPNGVIESLDYKFMKRVSDTEWTLATAEELALIVNQDGAHAGFTIGNTQGNVFSLELPPVAEGTIEWIPANGNLEGTLSADEVTNATPDSICGMVASYDDKLGLRIFAGAVSSNGCGV